MTLKGRWYRSLRPILPTIARDFVELWLAKASYLTDTGWRNSRRKRIAVDADGEPLPWYTYPAIRFLEERLPKGVSVFEYGSGYSTLWWSRRASEVISCEHDHDWFDRISKVTPPNVRLMLRRLEEGYAEAVLDSGRKFDVVVIDGRRRVDCATSAVPALSEAGVIVWDNSDREKYRQGYEFLKSDGFRRIDFWGIGPIGVREWATAIFYRPGNCLEI